MTREEVGMLVEIIGWGSISLYAGYVISCAITFVLSRIARKREVRRMHKIRKAGTE